MAGAARGRDLHVPLVREIRLEHRVRALSAWNDQLVLIDAFHQADGIQFGHHALASLEAVQARKRSGTLSFNARAA